jgi:pSer/pThr/pTyr-binding forkhead associated (FHA) protein
LLSTALPSGSRYSTSRDAFAPPTENQRDHEQHEKYKEQQFRDAEIQVLGECVTVVDLDSHNGTFIDDVRIQSSELAVGQKVTFGGVPFLLMSESQELECADSSIETADHRDKLRMVLPVPVASKLSWAQRRVLLHLVDGTCEHAGEAYKTVRKELEAYGHGLEDKPEIVALSKSDALTPEQIKQQTARLKRAAKPVQGHFSRIPYARHTKVHG